VQQPFRLALHGLNDIGVAVAGGDHGNTGIEVEEPVTVTS
jgi:hypothetical protein